MTTTIHPFRTLRSRPLWLGTGVIPGAQVTSGIRQASKNNDRVAWQVPDEKEAKKRLAAGKLSGAPAVPEDFGASERTESPPHALSGDACTPQILPTALARSPRAPVSHSP